MFKETLKQSQPVIYRTLDSALHKGNLSHCYLFVGERNAMMYETAILLAQSLVCQDKQDGWACEDCMSCIRVANDNYADLIILDGSKETIKGEAVADLQMQFSQTALEMAGEKIFIVNDCENMTAKAANSLLKFIEEPSNNTTGIFITTKITNVLPTIVSRCQTLNFKPLSTDYLYQQAVDKGIDELDAHLLSQMVKNSDELLMTVSNSNYTNALRFFGEFMNYYFTSSRLALLYLQDESFSKIKDRSVLKETLNYFFAIAVIFVNDYHRHYLSEDDTWANLLNQGRENNFDSVHFLQVVAASQDKLNKPVNLPLLIDQFYYQLTGGIL